LGRVAIILLLGVSIRVRLSSFLLSQRGGATPSGDKVGFWLGSNQIIFAEVGGFRGLNLSQWDMGSGWELHQTVRGILLAGGVGVPRCRTL